MFETTGRSDLFTPLTGSTANVRALAFFTTNTPVLHLATALLHSQVRSTLADMGGPKVGRLYCNMHMCDDSFASKDALMQHKANHPEPGPAQHRCETCGWSFGDLLALESHYMTAGHGVLPFPCENCPRRFLSDPALNEHRKTCRKPIQCENCHEKFPSEVAYNKHRKFPSRCADGLKKPAKKKIVSKEPVYIDIDAPAKQPNVPRYEVRHSSPQTWCRAR
jgi:hypothetical protein